MELLGNLETLFEINTMSKTVKQTISFFAFIYCNHTPLYRSCRMSIYSENHWQCFDLLVVSSLSITLKEYLWECVSLWVCKWVFIGEIVFLKFHRIKFICSIIFSFSIFSCCCMVANLQAALKDIYSNCNKIRISVIEFAVHLGWRPIEISSACLK